jgi:hypothetical protein
MDKSENRDRSGTLTGRIADRVVYTFRHLVSSTKIARKRKANNQPFLQARSFPFH